MTTLLEGFIRVISILVVGEKSPLQTEYPWQHYRIDTIAKQGMVVSPARLVKRESAFSAFRLEGFLERLET